MRARTLGGMVAMAMLLLRAGVDGVTVARDDLEKLIAAVEPELIQWRRHLHQHPELSNRETETARYVAERLRSFGLEPQTGIARTGVVALLRGGRPGPVVALRADMDGLPVREEVNLPFASKAIAEYEGDKVGVMHACGHDTHVAILLATARVLTQVKDRLPGSVKFIFQPAEEGAPLDERPAGAELMINEGVMQNPKVDAVFGLHVFANVPTGTITYRSGPFMAAADQFDIIVTGKQTHGSAPWRGVDPIVVGAQIVTRAADDRQPQRRHHAAAGDRVGGAVPVRRAQQHHSRDRASRRHDPDVRRCGAGRHSCAGEEDRRRASPPAPARRWT